MILFYIHISLLFFSFFLTGRWFLWPQLQRRRMSYAVPRTPSYLTVAFTAERSSLFPAIFLTYPDKVRASVCYLLVLNHSAIPRLLSSLYFIFFFFFLFLSPSLLHSSFPAYFFLPFFFFLFSFHVYFSILHHLRTSSTVRRRFTGLLFSQMLSSNINNRHTHLQCYFYILKIFFI